LTQAPKEDVRPVGAEAIALARRFGTPLYVYDAAEVERRYGRFVAAFPYQPVECHYAIVCNKNPFLVRFLHQLGAGVHANTPGDAYAALRVGIAASRIVYSGTNLNGADFEYLLRNRIPLNIDSLSQLHDLAARAPGTSVGLRLLIDSPTTRNRIGIAPSELGDALAVASSAAVRIVGLHMYTGTNTRRPSRFFESLDVLIGASDQLPDLGYIDIGGGYGIGYRDGEADLDLPTVGRAIAERMRELSARRGKPVRLLIEPGRAIVGSSGTLLTAVVSIKSRDGRRFVGVDTTVGNIAAPSVYHGYHRIEAVEPRGPMLELMTDVCGNTTHSADYLGRDLRLPRLENGDILALRDVGAYAYAMSSHFLNRPRPPEVVLHGDEAVLTTRRETFDDLTALHPEEPRE
jgi:diaminopimelate decarboxylase